MRKMSNIYIPWHLAQYVFIVKGSRTLLILVKDPLDVSGDDPNQVHYKTMHWM